MNKLSSLSAALAITLLTAGLAQANEQALRARAEVVAEREAAHVRGELLALVGEDSGSTWLALQAQPSPLSRQQVLAELRAAALRGDLHALIGEDSGSMFIPQQGVRTELFYAGPYVGSPAAEGGAAATA